MRPIRGCEQLQLAAWRYAWLAHQDAVPFIGTYASERAHGGAGVGAQPSQPEVHQGRWSARTRTRAHPPAKSMDSSSGLMSATHA